MPTSTWRLVSNVEPLANDRGFLDFLMRMLPARAAMEAAKTEAQTSRKLVRWTMGLAVATIILAIATIVLAGEALAWTWPFDRKESG